MLALGSILEGPDEKEIHSAAERHLENMVRAALPILTRLMADPVVQVKDTTAWTIGRICEYLPEVGMCLPIFLFYLFQRCSFLCACCMLVAFLQLVFPRCMSNRQVLMCIRHFQW